MDIKKESFLKFISSNKIYHSPKSLMWYFEELLFNGIELGGKNVLDIGGGIGLTSFYAASCNATQVDLLEPLSDGSGNVTIEKFIKMKNGLPELSKKINHINSTFQNFETNKVKYDVIVLHNSINHLNEEACINLLEQESAMKEYVGYFEKLSQLLNKGGRIIIADCSNLNFYNFIGLTNPLARSIEWHKHQKPETWAAILAQTGFSSSTIKWSSFKQLRFLGKILFSNKIASYFLTSHFIIHSKKL